MEEQDEGADVVTGNIVSIGHKFVKMTNGEDLISLVHAEEMEVSDEHTQLVFHLENPMKISFVTSEDGTPSIVLSKWIPFSTDTTVSVAAETVLTMTNTTATLIDFYKKNVASLAEKARKLQANTKQVHKEHPEYTFLEGKNPLNFWNVVEDQMAGDENGLSKLDAEDRKKLLN